LQLLSPRTAGENRTVTECDAPGATLNVPPPDVTPKSLASSVTYPVSVSVPTFSIENDRLDLEPTATFPNTGDPGDSEHSGPVASIPNSHPSVRQIAAKRSAVAHPANRLAVGILQIIVSTSLLRGGHDT